MDVDERQLFAYRTTYLSIHSNAVIPVSCFRREVSVSQTGCIGICQYEPVVEVFTPGQEKVTYVKMTAEKVEKVIAEHIKGGKVVEEYTYAKNV